MRPPSPVEDAVRTALLLREMCEVGGGALLRSVRTRAQNTPAAVCDMGVPPVLLFLSAKSRPEFYSYAYARFSGRQANPPDRIRPERDGYSAYLAAVAWYLARILGRELGSLGDVVRLARDLDSPANVDERVLVYSLLPTYLSELKKAVEAIFPTG